MRIGRLESASIFKYLYDCEFLLDLLLITTLVYANIFSSVPTDYICSIFGIEFDVRRYSLWCKACAGHHDVGGMPVMGISGNAGDGHQWVYSAAVLTRLILTSLRIGRNPTFRLSFPYLATSLLDVLILL